MGANSSLLFVRNVRMGLPFHLLNYGREVLLASLRRLCRIDLESRLCRGHLRTDLSREVAESARNPCS